MERATTPLPRSLPPLARGALPSLAAVGSHSPLINIQVNILTSHTEGSAKKRRTPAKKSAAKVEAEDEVDDEVNTEAKVEDNGDEEDEI